jgi:hypothetical protein
LSSASRSVLPVSLVIRWPENVAADVPKQLARRLAAGRIGATWAVEQSQQLAALASAVGHRDVIDAALMIRESLGALGAKLEGVLRTLKAISDSMSVVAISGAMRRGECERALCQAGIRAVVGAAEKAKATGIRSLPFGIVELTPHIEAPAIRRWLPLGGISRRFQSLELSSPAVINIDLSRVEPDRARSWRAIEQVIDQAADAAQSGAARVITISQLTAELSRKSASRPQRSILRTAA